MRLHRALFYILLAIFVGGVLLAIFIDPTSVMSRIATGLITGALVGLLSTIVNYAYAWQTYFSGLFSHAFELYNDLEEELAHASVAVENIETFSKDTLIKNAQCLTPEIAEKKEKEDHKYDKYKVIFDDAPYAPLFFSKKTAVTLDDLKDFVYFELVAISMFRSTKDSFVCLQDGHFSSKEEEELFIGDKDEFFDFIVRQIYNWRDYTAHCMRRFTSLLLDVRNSMKPLNITGEHRETARILNDLVALDLKGIPDRNPLEEKTDKFEDKMVDDDKDA